MTRSATTRFVLCADDFGLTRKVSRGILALIEAGRITATGAMTNRPAWREMAPALVALEDRADLGVHLSLTCGAPLGAMPLLAASGALPALAEVARGAVGSAAVRAEIAAEVERQLDAFEQATGRLPDFVDGHQHVHALPGVRAAVLPILARRYGGRGVYVRDTADRARSIMARGGASAKALAVKALAAGFGRAARAAGLATNSGFAGFSAFDPAASDAAMFARFIITPGPRHLVMCHPGEAGDDELVGLDPVIDARPAERDALMGMVWPDGATPVRFRDLA
jgi:hypothetical protein